MSRRYLVLFAVVAALAVGLTLAGRVARKTVPPPARENPVPAVALAIAARGGSVVPERAAVPKGHRVELTITNGEPHPVRIALAGYEDRLDLTLAPGARWTGSFLADRPGDDFAWLIEGRPAGRLEVTGSHLEEGRR